MKYEIKLREIETKSIKLRFSVLYVYPKIIVEFREFMKLYLLIWVINN